MSFKPVSNRFVNFSAASLSLSLMVGGVLLVSPLKSYGERYVTSFPFSENFNHNDYQDLVWTTGGALHEWMPSKGWKGSGAAKFFPNTIRDQYMGLGQFTHFNNGEGVEQLNVRFLVYYGSEWNPGGHQNKVLIMNRPVRMDQDSPEDPGLRTMLASYADDPENPSWRSFGVCEFVSGCSYEKGLNWPDGTDSFKIANPPLGRAGEWISVEVESSNITGKIKVYVYTQDGKFSGLYAQHDLVNTQYPIRLIDILGGYNNDAAIPSPNNYYMLDELAINDHYIGPPSGFLNGSPVNFKQKPVLSYGGANQDVSSTTNVSDTALKITGNGWKKIAFPYAVSSHTMLEFDFESNAQGEIHGIGFDTDNAISDDRTFKLYGTQNWGIQTAATYSGNGREHFVIPVGDYFTGQMQWLTFTNDHDVANPTAQSRFSNVRVYEE
jgi:hypothetical protein